jgi:hypothetical protein
MLLLPPINGRLAKRANDSSSSFKILNLPKNFLDEKKLKRFDRRLSPKKEDL